MKADVLQAIILSAEGSNALFPYLGAETMAYTYRQLTHVTAKPRAHLWLQSVMHKAANDGIRWQAKKSNEQLAQPDCEGIKMHKSWCRKLLGRSSYCSRQVYSKYLYTLSGDGPHSPHHRNICQNALIRGWSLAQPHSFSLPWQMFIEMMVIYRLAENSLLLSSQAVGSVQVLPWRH